MAASTSDDQHGGDGDGEHGAAKLDERPALVDFVDPVHGPAERADVAGGGPEGGEDADDQGESGGGGAAELLDRAADGVHGVSRARSPGRSPGARRWFSRAVRRCPAATRGPAAPGRWRAPSSRSGPRRGPGTGPW